MVLETHIHDCLQIQTVGKIPSGFPSPTFSNFETGGQFGKLLITSLIVTGVGILETVGIAKALAAKNGYEINANQVSLPLVTNSIRFLVLLNDLECPSAKLM